MRTYKDWTENELRNAIWHINEGRSIPGGYTDKDEIREELRIRGLDDKGYHE